MSYILTMLTLSNTVCIGMVLIKVFIVILHQFGTWLAEIQEVQTDYYIKLNSRLGK